MSKTRRPRSAADFTPSAEPQPAAPAHVGHVIIATREAQGLSRYALAKAAGIDATYLRKIELGITPSPGWDIMCAIADVLGVPLQQLRVPARPPA